MLKLDAIQNYEGVPKFHKKLMIIVNIINEILYLKRGYEYNIKFDEIVGLDKSTKDNILQYINSLEECIKKSNFNKDLILEEMATVYDCEATDFEWLEEGLLPVLIFKDINFGIKKMGEVKGCKYEKESIGTWIIVNPKLDKDQIYWNLKHEYGHFFIQNSPYDDKWEGKQEELLIRIYDLNIVLKDAFDELNKHQLSLLLENYGFIRLSKMHEFSINHYKDTLIYSLKNPEKHKRFPIFYDTSQKKLYYGEEGIKQLNIGAKQLCDFYLRLKYFYNLIKKFEPDFTQEKYIIFLSMVPRKSLGRLMKIYEGKLQARYGNELEEVLEGQ